MDPNAGIATDLITFGYSVSRQKTDSYALHCHNFYEVYYFVDGDVDYLVEGQKYKPTSNSLLILSPNVFHGVKINQDTPYKRFALHFHPELILPERRSFLLQPFPACGKNSDQKIYFEDPDTRSVLSCLEALEECAKKPPRLREQLLPICIEALLAQIVSISHSGLTEQDLPDDAFPSDTITAVLLYLNQHLQEPVTLDQLSEQFFISKHHLNKVFRRATGTTVMDYLLRKRISAAQQYLINGCSTKEAALLCGFNDYSAFYRSYVRILGHPPIQDKGAAPSLSGHSKRSIEYTELRRNE